MRTHPTHLAKAAVALLMLNAAASHSQTLNPAFQPSSTPTFIHDTTHDDGGYVNLGLAFTPTSDITVNALGFYDLNVGSGDEPLGSSIPQAILWSHAT